MQKRGTSFHIFCPDSKDPEIVWDSLMDTGTTRSCINYNTFMKLGNSNLRQQGTPTVTVVDGGQFRNNRHNHLQNMFRNRNNKTGLYSVHLP